MTAVVVKVNTSVTDSVDIAVNIFVSTVSIFMTVEASDIVCLVDGLVVGILAVPLVGISITM